MFTDYEVWLVARKRENWFPYDGSPGHAFIGVTGVSIITGQREAVRTYSFWPENSDTYRNQEPGTDLTIDFKTDFDHLKDVLAGRSISPRGYAIRKMRLSKSQTEWLVKSGFYKAGCKKYIGALGVGDLCNCMDYSTRLWHYLTGGQEDLRIRAFGESWWVPILGPAQVFNHELWPDALVDAIEKMNQQDGDPFFN